MFIILLLMLLYPSMLISTETYISGTVVRVIDGDTIHVKDATNTYKIRLYGIDAPEMGQPYGKESKERLTHYIYSQYVQVYIIDIDRYNRHVGIVYLNGIDINLKMVIDGYAWYYKQYCKINSICKLYADAHTNALNIRAGLWAPYPYSPHEWRKIYRNRKVLSD